MHRPGAAEGEQGEAARVDAALDRDHAQRPHHLLVGDADDALGGLQLVEAERAGELADRAAGGVDVQGDAAGQLRVGGEAAEQQVGVGHRGLCAAASVTGGPWLGSRRARSDAQGAAAVAPADRAAAGADGVDVDHRQLDDATVDRARVGAAHLAVLDHADVAGGAAHVEAERVAVAAGAAIRPAPTAPPAGPESTLQAPARAASAALATPPEDCITSGLGRPADSAASPSRPR